MARERSNSSVHAGRIAMTYVRACSCWICIFPGTMALRCCGRSAGTGPDPHQSHRPDRRRQPDGSERASAHGAIYRTKPMDSCGLRRSRRGSDRHLQRPAGCRLSGSGKTHIPRARPFRAAGRKPIPVVAMQSESPTSIPKPRILIRSCISRTAPSESVKSASTPNPSSGGIGSRLKHPSNRFSEKKTLRMVATPVGEPCSRCVDDAVGGNRAGQKDSPLRGRFAS